MHEWGVARRAAERQVREDVVRREPDVRRFFGREFGRGPEAHGNVLFELLSGDGGDACPYGEVIEVGTSTGAQTDPGTGA